VTLRARFPVAAPPEAWAALGDADRLAAALPGGRSVSRGPDGDGTLHVAVEVAVAAVKGLWAGTVVPLDGDAVRVRGSGAPGSLDLVVRAAPDRSAVEVEGEVDGPLATVGGAVLAAAARRWADDLMAALAEPPPAPPAARPPAPSLPRRRWLWVAGAAGAAAVAVAAVAARRRRVVRRRRRGR
jgi:carbon monoxide dehydrogenase subunit G